MLVIVKFSIFDFDLLIIFSLVNELTSFEVLQMPMRYPLDGYILSQEYFPMVLSLFEGELFFCLINIRFACC